MKKTISISVAGTLFWIEEDSFVTLDNYLKGIKAHFSGEAECDEIVSDIESRIAEQFLECGKKIITQHEVEAMILSMGDVGDFDSGKQGHAETESAGTKAAEQKGKRLFRDPDNKVLAGVASGIAAYLGIEVLWVRLAFIVLTLMNGLGIVLYILFWLAMPEAKSASEQLAMSGTPVTLETISERIKERVDEVKSDKDSTLRRLAQLPVDAMQLVIRFFAKTLIPLVRMILGVFISLGAAFAILGISVAFGFAVFNLDQSFMDIPFRSVIPTGIIIAFLVATYFVILVPVLFVTLLGSSLVAGKSTVRTSTALGLIGLWFIAMLSAGVIGASYGTRVASYIETAPEYKNVSETTDVAPFTMVSARNGLRVTYIESASSSVRVIGHAQQVQSVAIDSAGGTLSLVSTDRHSGLCFFCDNVTPTIEVRSPTLLSFDGENAVRFEAAKISSTSTFTITLTNASQGVLNVDTPELHADLRNASWANISGSTTKAELSAENQSRINTEDLALKEATLSAENISNIFIGDSEKIDASATNGSRIRYQGTSVVTEHATNNGRIYSSGNGNGDSHR